MGTGIPKGYPRSATKESREHSELCLAIEPQLVRFGAF